MKTLGKQTKTLRGFGLVEFKDFYDKQCSLQQSSLATDDAIWLGLDEDVPGKKRMHLNREQVEALVGHLQKWLKSGSFE